MKPIKDFERYLVMATGRIISTIGNDGPHELKQGGGEKRYLGVYLHGEKKRQFREIHRIVAETFIPKPEGKYEVNHKDGDRHNNHVDNLEWVTHAENVRHATEMGLMSRKPMLGLRKLSMKQVIEIKYKRTEGIGIRELGRLYGIDNKSIRRILSGQTYKEAV